MVEELKCNLHNTFKKSCTSERTGNKGQTIILFLFFSSQHTHGISLSIIWIPVPVLDLHSLPHFISVCSAVGHICADKTSEKCWTILSLQPRDKVAMLVANTITFFPKNFTWNWCLVSRGEKCCCSWLPTWPPWCQVQTNNGPFHSIFNFGHGPVRENPSIPLERPP